MHTEFPFLSLLLITGLAVFVPLLASRLRRVRLPIVVSEILVGMIIGKSGLNLVESGEALQFLTTFGFTYLMTKLQQGDLLMLMGHQESLQHALGLLNPNRW
jgi:Kef-type K+ transport system membrane component KefB